MTGNVAEQGLARWWRLSGLLGADLPKAVKDAVPALLFGLRLWASVCLSLYVAFWLQLDEPYWAGSSAAIVCQPQLGASLRKARFFLIGTLAGAVAIVVLTACFPQDRAPFLVGLALWAAICAFTATVLRNFASYGAALAGYTAGIVVVGALGATGGPDSGVFMLAVSRATEVSIGIVCSAVILAGTDLGGARTRLAGLFANLTADITGQFATMLAFVGPRFPDTLPQRQELVKRVMALEPAVDAALGESSELRYYRSILQTAVRGLFNALDGWRGVALHLQHLPEDAAKEDAQTIARSLPFGPLSAELDRRDWTTIPVDLLHRYEAAEVKLLSAPAGTPSLRYLFDETARQLAGIVRVLDGIALLVEAPDRPRTEARGFRLSVPDWAPAFINAARAFVAITTVALIWVVTAWPSGASTIVFVSIVTVLLAPRGDQAYAVATAFMFGTVGAIALAATVEFAVLPKLDSFAGLSLVFGLCLVPIGFGIAYLRNPLAVGALTAMGLFFVFLLQPTNEMSYDTLRFYNTALATFVGCVVGALSFRLLPPLSPAVRTRRLLAAAVRDLRRSAIRPSRAEDLESRMYGRLVAMPPAAEPRQRSQLLAMLSVGHDILQLRRIAASLGLDGELGPMLTALAQGDSRLTRTRLAAFDRVLASLPEKGSPSVMRARAYSLSISEVLTEHAAFFDSGGAK